MQVASAVQKLIIFLAGKPGGGGRPTHLLPSPVRVWEAWRFKEFQQWGRDHRRPYEWAAEGRAAERAVWRVALDDEAGEDEPEGTAIALLDIAKAYEYIQLNHLWVLGLVFGIPLQFMAVQLEVVAFPRIVKPDGAHTDPIQSMKRTAGRFPACHQVVEGPRHGGVWLD